MDRLLSIKVFCTVAEHRSFAAAAQRLNLSPAMVSKHVMHLERHLSARLLNRTSRQVSLTEVGAIYFDQARTTLEDLESVEAAVSRVAVTPKGAIRMSAPVWMANPAFVRILGEYRERFPEVTFDIDLSDRQVNLVSEGFDLALRISKDLGQGLVARKISDFTFCLVGSPDYLDKAGRPRTLEELDGHAILLYSLIPIDKALLAAQTSGGRSRPRIKPVLRSGNETLLHLAALDGQGLASLPHWLIQQDLRDGLLEAVIPDGAGFSVPLFAVYPTRKYVSAKVRTFLDFLAAHGRFS